MDVQSQSSCFDHFWGGLYQSITLGLSKVGHWRPKHESSPKNLREQFAVDVNMKFQFKARCFKMFLQQFWNVHLKNCGFMIQFDEHIFQRGWFNHQLVTSVDVVPKSNSPTRRCCDSQAKYCFTCPEERTTHRYRFDTFRGSTY